MSRAFGLMLVGWIAIGLTGCVGPMGGGCCNTNGGAVCGAKFCDSCDSGCGDPTCVGCDSCTGCGELYVDPWINHPADCVDPCDSCGNFNGQSCGKCRPIFAGFKTLWGYRCGCDPGPVATTDRSFAPRCSAGCTGCDSCSVEPACGCEGACSCGGVFEPGCGLEPTCGCEGACSCGSVFEPGCGLEPTCGCEGPCDCEPACGCEGACSCGQGVISGGYGPGTGEYVIESPGIQTQGEVFHPVIEAPYKPSRTRKIFNPRTQTARGFLNDHRR